MPAGLAAGYMDLLVTCAELFHRHVLHSSSSVSSSVSSPLRRSTCKARRASVFLESSQAQPDEAETGMGGRIEWGAMSVGDIRPKPSKTPLFDLLGALFFLFGTSSGSFEEESCLIAPYHSGLHSTNAKLADDLFH